MTLSVYPYRRTANGDIEWLETPSDFTDLAGLESTRQSFWGSDELKSLGMSLITTLANTDIYAEGCELIRLEEEIKTVEDYLFTLSESGSASITDKEITYRIERLSNVSAAIEVAKRYQGGVYIG
ncbi:MAG: hypothetical protein AAFQ95_02350 [Cyanobacteria bacterium J06621_3]